MHLACSEGNSDVVELLINHEVFSQVTNEVGAHELIHAQLLIIAIIIYKDEKTAKDLAIENHRFVCVEIFERQTTQV